MQICTNINLKQKVASKIQDLEKCTPALSQAETLRGKCE